MSSNPRYSALRVPVSTLGNGHELYIVAHRLDGGSPGPSIGISGGVHGDETDTVQYVRTFIELMKETPFAGTILAVSCANPLAFESRTRSTPNDMIDLNRVFPGDPDGLLTHQLAHKLFQLFSTQCEYFVDFHCGGIFPTVDYVYLHNDEGLARSVGSRLVYVGRTFAGSLTFCLENEGLHTTAIELGGGRASSVSTTKRACEALMRVLMYIGAVKGDLRPPPDQITLDEMRVIRPHHGGSSSPRSN